MKTFKFLAAASLIAAVSSPALAGSPDNPGAGGQAVKAAVETVKANGATWGSVVSANAQTPGNPNLGQAIQDAKDALGGSPNPANDHGGGNGP